MGGDANGRGGARRHDESRGGRPDPPASAAVPPHTLRAAVAATAVDCLGRARRQRARENFDQKGEQPSRPEKQFNVTSLPSPFVSHELCHSRPQASASLTEWVATAPDVRCPLVCRDRDGEA